MTRRRHLTDEEAQLFAHAMKDVRAARGRAKKALAVKPKPAKPPASASVKARSATKPAAATPKPKTSPPPSPPPPMTIDRRTEQKLKRGRTPIDAILDLHGLKQQAAHFKLMHFIARASEDGHKAVLVITGKGSRGSEGGIMPAERRGVLRAQVPLWLEQAPLSHYVRGIKPAGPRHGGAGALYVLIKRKK